MLTIYLKTEDGKDTKEYSVDFFSTKNYRQTVEVLEKINKDKVTLKDIEIMTAYIVNVFRKQFTADELSEGLSKKELTDLAGKLFSMILYDMTEEEVDEAMKKALEDDAEKE